MIAAFLPPIYQQNQNNQITILNRTKKNHDEFNLQWNFLDLFSCYLTYVATYSSTSSEWYDLHIKFQSILIKYR